MFDDDHYYMGSMMADLLAGEGYQVALATSGLCVSSWTEHTLEQGHIERRLVGLGVEILMLGSFRLAREKEILTPP